MESVCGKPMHMKGDIQMNKNGILTKKIITSFRSAMRDVESLNEFFYRSNKTLVDYKLSNEKSCMQGKKIADLFDQIMEYDGYEERNKKIEEIKSIELEQGIKVSDVCNIVPCSKDNETLRYSIKKEYRNKLCYSPTEAKKKYDHINKYEYILKESVLSHIIVSFENYLSQIYRLLLETTPLLYFENQTILLADVFKENFLEAINDKFESEIDNKMRNSLDTLSIICAKENININRYEKIVENFTEIYYRRNAYVHTQGRANKDYMKKVGSSFLKNISDNDFLVCDDIYIENAIITLCKLLFSIAYELLVKFNATVENIEAISMIFFEKLKQKHYILCKYAYYSLSQNKSVPFYNRTMYRMNYINAAKQLDEKNLVKKELEKLDISIATDKFKIGKYCLEDNYAQVYEMLKETYPNTFDAIAIREWPIFINFRETELYEKFISEHADDFEMQCLEVDQNEVPETESADAEKNEG